MIKIGEPTLNTAGVVKLIEFGERLDQLIPSQASYEEGVTTILRRSRVQAIGIRSGECPLDNDIVWSMRGRIGVHKRTGRSVATSFEHQVL